MLYHKVTSLGHKKLFIMLLKGPVRRRRRLQRCLVRSTCARGVLPPSRAAAAGSPPSPPSSGEVSVLLPLLAVSSRAAAVASGPSPPPSVQE